MKMILTSLIIKCRKKVIEFPFSESITYIYGKMGAGKTTITMLISFCLGEELINTPALQQEFLGATLNFKIAENTVSLTRNKEDKNQVFIEWSSVVEEEKKNSYVMVPIIGTKGETIIPGENIENLSDMLFYLMGCTPPKVRRNKISQESELIRLSFKNIMLFWYLDQDNIDSSFFHLEEKGGYYKYSSRDVMRMILGFYYEHIASLENDLSNIQSNKKGFEVSITQLTNFLIENNIDEVEAIENKIINLEIDKNKILSKREDALKGISRNNQHIVDELRTQIRLSISNISELENAIYEITKQVESRTQLREEYFYASIKLKNLDEAKEILKDANFVSCPQCGSDIKNIELNIEICSLCKQPLGYNDSEDYNIIENDLRDRRNEIDLSIEKMSNQRDILVKELNVFNPRKAELDKRLSLEEIEYDSLYLSNIKKFDIQIYEVCSDIKYLEKIKVLPMKILGLYSKVQKLKTDETNKKEEIRIAKDEANKQENKLEELKKVFINILNKVKFPGIKLTDYVTMDTKSFYPKILTKDNDINEMDFINLSSGGKKTIFKCCFAFAIQKLIKSQDIPFPNILVIDTPMKNISERENKEVFESFYKFVYEIMSDELKDMQLIIIDKELYPPDTDVKIDILSKHMTPDDPEHPGLIDYYSGH
ncbi:AAA family ATPase [Clostridium estertheticum]|uniref:AAA family ATPase n=1 Tax=Clostridium estertheticum TaxID=238834 RepID=UPI0013E92140|nr:AAA family ATPase [Clostridium estertheticum]MBZ9688442.1 AAA family ATPase [Clostridium estertheticum]